MSILDETGVALLDETGAILLDESAPDPGPPQWQPGDPWPGTAGGATRDGWSPYIRLYLFADIGAGQPWTIGPPDTDAKLDRGNVISSPGQTADATLAVDLTAHLTALHVQAGASTAAGVRSKSDAAVLEAELWDPDGLYDPLNPYSPYGLTGSQRLVPGVPIRCFTEIIDPDTLVVTALPVITATADRWQTEWAKHPNDRRAILTATDPTKHFAKLQYPAQSEYVGVFDSIRARIDRITTAFGWDGGIIGPTVHTEGHLSAFGLQPTDMSQTGWEQLNEAIELELGFLHFTRAGVLRWLDRTAWTTPSLARIIVGDPADNPNAHDIVTAARPLAHDQTLHNSIYAAADGGTVTHHVTADASIAQWGEHTLTRTNLQLNSPDDVLEWGRYLLALDAYPQTALERITVQPSLSTEPWTAYIGILGAGLITAIIRTLWTPPGQPSVPIDSRIVGWSMDVTPWDWSIDLQLVSANISTNAPIFQIGPAVRDTLDDGYIIAF